MLRASPLARTCFVINLLFRHPLTFLILPCSYRRSCPGWIRPAARAVRAARLDLAARAVRAARLGLAAPAVRAGRLDFAGPVFDRPGAAGLRSRSDSCHHYGSTCGYTSDD